MLEVPREKPDIPEREPLNVWDVVQRVGVWVTLIGVIAWGFGGQGMTGPIAAVVGLVVSFGAAYAKVRRGRSESD